VLCCATLYILDACCRPSAEVDLKDPAAFYRATFALGVARVPKVPYVAELLMLCATMLGSTVVLSRRMKLQAVRLRQAVSVDITADSNSYGASAAASTLHVVRLPGLERRCL